MSYVDFFLAFICPWILMGFFLISKRDEPMKAIITGIAIVSFIVTLLTLPFIKILSDNGILILGVGEGEKLYFGLFFQGILSGLILYFLRPKNEKENSQPKSIKMWGVVSLSIITLVGVIMIRNEVTRHLGMLIVWAGPLLFLEWLGGSSFVWRTRRMFVLAVLISASYMWFVEGMAINSGLWSANQDSSLGITVFGLPLERAVFHFLFALVLCQGLEIFWRVFRRYRLIA